MNRSFRPNLTAPLPEVGDVYSWPIQEPETLDETDQRFYPWARAVQQELEAVREQLYEPMPDDPGLMTDYITDYIDGWAPRVAALVVRAEWHLNKAKKTKWPSKQSGPDNKPTTEADRTAVYAERLADYRFVRDELENMLIRMVDRTRWAQSARKSQAEAQGA
jgi:hypothetical protein